MEKFTQGEWQYSHAKGQAKKYVMCNGLRIATVPINSGRTDAKANAHLIAVAPEMYEMLRVFSEMVMPTAGDLYEQCDKAKLLIAKARGEHE